MQAQRCRSFRAKDKRAREKFRFSGDFTYIFFAFRSTFIFSNVMLSNIIFLAETKVESVYLHVHAH